MRALAIGSLLLNALVWGLSWWQFRLLQGLGLGPLASTALSYGIGALLLAAARPRGLGQLWRHPQLAWIGLAAGATNACFNVGVTHGDVVRVVLLFYLMPVWSALLAWPLLGERLSRQAVLRLALALSGAAIVLWPAGGGLPLPRQPADWLGLVGGITFACNNLLLRRWADTPAAARALAMFIGGGLVPAALLGLQGGWTLPATDWPLPLLALALAFLAANLGLQYGAALLPAAVTSIVMTFEIPVATLSSWLLGAAVLSAQTWLGGSLIAAAVLLAARSDSQPQEAQT